MCGFCNVLLCEIVGFVMFGCVNVLGFVMCDVKCGFFNVWLCVGVL